VTKHPTCPKSIDNAFVVVIINMLHTMIKGDNRDVLAILITISMRHGNPRP